MDVGTEIPPSFGADGSGHPGNSPLCLCRGPRRGGPDAASAVTAVRIGRGFPRSPPDGPRRFSYRDPTRTGDDICPSDVEAVPAPQDDPRVRATPLAPSPTESGDEACSPEPSSLANSY